MSLNAGPKIRPTMESLRAQAPKLEFLLIDGGSTDQSVASAREIAETLPHTFITKSESDRGIYDAMNKGVAMASGRYLLFLGAGDVLLPNSLDRVSELLPENDTSFVYGDALMGGKRYDGLFKKTKLCRRNICHQAIFYGREIFKTIGPYNLRYPRLADWEFNMRCFGSRRIPKLYVDVVVSNFEEGGIGWQKDNNFVNERLKLIWKWMGATTYFRHRWRHLKHRITGNERRQQAAH